MSDAILTGPGETWRPTGELRWIERRIVDADPEYAAVRKAMWATPSGTPFPWPQGTPFPSPGIVVPVLQQRWASDAGADEWRDVPTVEG